MLSLVFKRRLLQRCPPEAAFSPCRCLSSYIPLRSSNANITRQINAGLDNQKSGSSPSEPSQQRPGRESLLRQESFGRPVALGSSEGAVFKGANGKEYLDVMTGTPLDQFGKSREDFARVILQHVSLIDGILSL
jgi:hypothetical protein